MDGVFLALSRWVLKYQGSGCRDTADNLQVLGTLAIITSSRKASKSKTKRGEIYGKHFLQGFSVTKLPTAHLKYYCPPKNSKAQYNLTDLLTQKKRKLKDSYQGACKLRKARGSIKQNVAL